VKKFNQARVNGGANAIVLQIFNRLLKSSSDGGLVISKHLLVFCVLRHHQIAGTSLELFTTKYTLPVKKRKCMVREKDPEYGKNVRD
jgi:hypothetical protein